ncbi:MAG: HAMP domain-containing protein, partial [Vitreimonas sp.]
MVQLAADQSTDAAVLTDRPQGRSTLVFIIGLAVAGFLTASATIALSLGEGLAGGANASIRALLIASIALSAALAGILLHRILRVARAWRSAASGARLHVRFVTLFSLAALAPAIIVAAFLGFTFSQGVERWFSQRVERAIESAADVGRAYVDLVSDPVGGEVEAMAVDLNLAQRGLVEEPERYVAFLAAQAERRDLVSAYVIDADGRVLARAERDGAVGYKPPSPEAFASADRGEVFVRFDEEEDRLRALYRLSAYDRAYVYVSRPVEPGLVAQLRAFRASVADYRAAREQQNALRGLFGLAYISTALIVVLAAGWVGLTSATRVAEPIGRLVGAARRVASGDLKARVAVGEERDEVDALANAFNGMTAQLEAQRRDLVEAQEDAESRSQFIQTVLGGVSAGVVGLDRDGRIAAFNRSAAHLLGHGEYNDMMGRRLVDVAPEFGELLNQPAPAGETPPQRVDLAREGGSLNLSVR